MKQLKPDYYFEHFTEITPDWCKEKNISLILSDIDSTLAAHNKLGDERLDEWLKQLKENQIELVCVSNNNNKRVEAFTDNHGVLCVGNCGKPGTRKIEKTLYNFENIQKDKMVFLGDQIFTDIWCGKNLGIKTVLVAPIGSKQPINIKLKRIIENWLLRNWRLL